MGELYIESGTFMIKRPILIVVLGYIIGIIIGLYCKNSIALFILFIACTYFAFKRAYKEENHNKKIKNYLKIFNVKKGIIIFFISAIISNIIIIILNNSYESKYKDIQKAEYIAIISSIPKEKQYGLQYKIKVETVDNSKKYKNTYLYLNLKEKVNLEYGDKIKFQGNFIEPEIQRNYNGFNYKEYLKSIGIYGTVKTNTCEVIGKEKTSIIKKLANNMAIMIRKIINDNIQKEPNKSLLSGILIGYDDELQEDVKEDFRNSSLSHILAVSGMHVSYIVLCISSVFTTLKIHKKIAKVCIIILLIFFVFLTGEMPSVKRACIMAILSICANLLYRKSDIITNISTSLLIILIQNPFSINDIGLILSFTATIGIVIFNKIILNLLSNICNTIKNSNFIKKSQVFKNYIDIEKYRNNTINNITNESKVNKKYEIVTKVIKNKKEQDGNINKFLIRIKEIISVSISAQILILPLSILFFNKLSITFLLSNILVSFIIGIIIILGFISIIFPFKFLFIILDLLLNMLNGIANIFANIPISKIAIITLDKWIIVLYYIIVIIFTYLYELGKKERKRKVEKEILTKVKMGKFFFFKKKRILMGLVLLLIIVKILSFFPKDLRIHFIDVGQGDSSLIITPNNKTILIDGGGNLNGYDVGKNTLLPYLLDRKVQKIDYMIISHFDADHANGLIAVLENIKVEKVLISQQIEKSSEYKKVMEVVKTKRIKVCLIKAGDNLMLEKDVHLEILYPKEELVFSDLNNNSIVARLEYKNFSMLFTGDIEEKAEEDLLDKYKYTNKLKVTVLKVAHHGSKTSSKESIIDEIRPKIALIGVGKNNLFGHPNNKVIERLKNIGAKIYRTDETGEITITVTSKGKIKVERLIE